jgi:hypothetical protein
MSYLCRHMTRLLLTLLALLTGLTVQNVPAQARICGASESEIGAIESSPGSEKVAAQERGATAPRARREVQGRRSCMRVRPQPVYIPTVQLGIDRARE